MGQRGEVYEVKGNQVAVILDMTGKKASEGEDEKQTDEPAESQMRWLDGIFYWLRHEATLSI